MPRLRTYNLFISHAWGYNASYVRLVRMLRKAPYFNFRNFSVPSHRGLIARTNRELKQELYDQIRPVHVAIILAGMYATYSYWIQEEIDLAERLGKPILGIYPWGSQRAPRSVQEAADLMVGWNTASIVDAIRELVTR